MCKILHNDAWYKFEFHSSLSSLFSFYFQSYLQYSTTAQQLLHLLDHLEKTSVKEGLPTARDATYEDKQTLPQRLLNSDLFPESRFLIYNDYLPFKVTETNFAIACDTTDVVLSGSEVTHTVSFGSCLNSKRCCLVVFFHGYTVSDLLAHLKLHLQRYLAKMVSSNSKLDLQINFPMALPIDTVKESLIPFIGENILYDYSPREAMVVVEQPLPVLKSNIWMLLTILYFIVSRQIQKMYKVIWMSAYIKWYLIHSDITP